MAPGVSTFELVLDIPAGTPAGIYTNTTSDVTGVIDTCGECSDPVTGLPVSGDLAVVGMVLAVILGAGIPLGVYHLTRVAGRIWLATANRIAPA